MNYPVEGQWFRPVARHWPFAPEVAAQVITINAVSVGGCACPIDLGDAFRSDYWRTERAITSPPPPDPWRDIDAGVRAIERLIGATS